MYVIKNVRKYILASYPFDESLGISRNAYDVMNSRISRGGQLVYRKKITIQDNRLRDKKGNAITISKMEDIHNSFINNLSLDQAYGFAGVFADTTLEIYRCDRPTGRMANASFLYPELGQISGEDVAW